MFFNYLKTSFRSLFRQKFFSAVNIFGLAIAMTISMSVIMLVTDQLTYDQYNSKSDRIYRITTVGAFSQEGPGEPSASSSMRLKDELLNNYSGIDKVVRLKNGFGNSWLEFENQNLNIPLSGFFSDPEVLDLFEYELEYGNPKTALEEPYSVVLTRKAVDKIFKVENPMGQIIRMGDLGNFTITGVLKETKNKSHIVFESLASMSSVRALLDDQSFKEEMQSWVNNTNGWTYLLLKEGKSLTDIQSNLDQIYQDQIASIDSPDFVKLKYTLQPLLDITPGPMLDNSIGPILPWLFVYFFGGLALIILLTSCFNFTNLSIARSITRAKEIGVRKVTGATRWQIFTQFISEAIFLAFLAFIIAIGLMFFFKPMVLQLNFAQMLNWDLTTNYSVYFLFLAFVVIVGFMAGLFPAIVLSAFQPITVLKNLSTTKLFSHMNLRKFLMTSQLTLSLFFILTLILVYNQLTLFVRQDLGFNSHNNLVIKASQESHALLKSELSQYTNFISISSASHLPATGSTNIRSLKRNLEDNEWIDLSSFSVDENYLQNMNMILVAGDFFMEGNGKLNQKSIIINQQAAQKFGFETENDAINNELFIQADSSKKIIVGVVKDYNHKDLFDAITPMCLIFEPENYNLLQFAFSGSYEDAASVIQKPGTKSIQN